MIVRFNSLNRTERPVLTLCNPGSTYDNGKLTNVVGILTNHEAEENVFNFNSSSELNFRLNKVTTGDDEADEYMGFLYDAVKNKRLIFIDDIGFFLINNVQEQYDNLNTFKDVTAKSIDIELQQRNIPFIPDGTYRFLDGDGKSGILNMIVDTLPYWTIGTVDSSVASKYRTFEDVDTSLNCLGFMIDNLQDAYECIILFDTINRTINVYDQNNYIHQTDIHISKKDIINMSKVSESSDDLYTAITVSGDSDVLISAINPLGTNTLYNFSYYLDWMSAPLKEKVIAWNAKISSHEADYYNLNLDYYNKEKQAHDIELEINRLETQLSMYERCRDNIVANNDTDYVVSYNEAISASGGTVITIKPEISQTLAEIDRLIGICRTNMSNAQTQLSAINAQIEAIADEINTIRSDVSFTNNFTNDELSELNNYVFEGTYKDEYVVITDIMDYAEQFSQMKILYDRARAQLLRISQPTQEFEIDVENFLFEREFAHASDQLETGCLINVELNDNDIAELFLSSIKVNYDDHNLSLTFGNRYNKFDPKTLFDNVLGSVSKSANTLGYVKDLLYPIKAGELNAIKNQLQSARDLSMIGALTSDNEEVVIDSSGYTGKKKLSDGIYDPKQIKITNNNIVFTKDGWETSSLAIGDIILPDGSSVYGVNAQALIGDIIIGTELHIKDSQGQDILTVIDGRISTEVSEVKSAAASGTFEYYDPSNLSWTEQGNVDYFGYGLSQDGTETDTGVKAAGNNNKYFLNKHNGNLYKSNGTKWVFQKTLSPRFDNYSTIAYTDNKAGTAESNAIANTTSQVNSAKSTIAGATSKYDTSGQTITYYGYGTPNISGASSGQKYLDQDSGYVYTKGSGSTWTKSSTPLTLISTKVAQDAATDATNKANAAEGNAKTYAEGQATQAKNDAIADTVNKLKNYSTTTQMNTAITESAENIRLTASKAVSKYDITDKTVNFYAYGLSDDLTTTDTGIKATGNSGKFVLNQTNGKLYKSNGSKWVYQETLTTITDKLDSKITVTAEGIRSDVSANYSTKTYAENQASTAESNAKTYAEEQANTAESNAKTYAEDKASAAESNAITNATNQVSTAKATIASSTLKYDETGITVNYYGYGAPTEIAGATQGKIYLDQNDGYYYTKGSGSNWTKSSNALPLYADQKANAAKSEAISAASADATQKANQAEENAIADATNQVNNATTTIANATNKYDTTGLTITYFGYGVPDIATATSGQKYLDQNDGYVYTKKSGSGWTKSTSALTLITTKVATDAANDATTKANNAISTAATDATAKANTAENNAKTAAANAMSKYDEGSLTINYYGFGVPTTVAGSSQGEIYLDQNTGYYYTKGSGSTWTKSTNALPLYADQKATEAYNNALSYVGTYYITSEDANTTINQTKKEIEMKAAKAVSKYEIPVGITINYAGYGTPTVQGVKATAANQYYLDQETGNLYKSDSNKNWSSTPVQSLTIITDNLNSKITQTSEQISLEANARLEATVGYTSKNRLELTIDTKTDQGITFTVDKTNGTITANGTSTGVIDVFIPISPDLSGDYYYSGVPDGGSGSTYYMYPWDVTSVSRPKKFDGVTPCLDDFGGTSQEIKFIKGHEYRLNIRIQKRGFVANNLIFRPMIRDKAFADDDTFEPFANVQSVTTNLQSQITQNANQIQLKVSAGDVCSVISQSSDTITLSSGRLIINAGNFQLDSTGRMSASAGDFGGWEIGSEYVGDTWDHYIASTKNQYGSIRWHSIHYGDYPSGTDPDFITALDIKDPDGETLFRVAMNGSISTEAGLWAHEASLGHASLGQSGAYTGQEHLELLTGDFDDSGGYPPSYIKFYDASGNEHLSLVTEGIRLSQDICFRLYNNEVAIGIQSKNVRFYAKGVYLPNGSAVTSDERQKCNIERLDTRYLDIIKNIEPVRFKYLNDSMGDYHSGFIAQDVLKTLSAAGLSQSEVGAFVDTMGDGSDYALRYGEFIPMLQKWVKELDNRITEIERKIRNE